MTQVAPKYKSINEIILRERERLHYVMALWLCYGIMVVLWLLWHYDYVIGYVIPCLSSLVLVGF